MAEKRSDTSMDMRASSLSRDQHDGAATYVDQHVRETTEAKEEGLGSAEDLHSHEYLSGFRLVMVLSGLTLAVFLMLLDASIVATVRWAEPSFLL